MLMKLDSVFAVSWYTKNLSFITGKLFIPLYVYKHICFNSKNLYLAIYLEYWQVMYVCMYNCPCQRWQMYNNFFYSYCWERERGVYLRAHLHTSLSLIITCKKQTFLSGYLVIAQNVGRNGFITIQKSWMLQEHEINTLLIIWNYFKLLGFTYTQFHIMLLIHNYYIKLVQK